MIKRIKYYLFILMAFFIFQPEVSAGSLSIWASASNVTVGSKVTISVNAKNIAGTFNVSSSNNSVLSGGVTGEWLEDNTYTYTFTAKSVGKSTITVLAVDVADFDTNGGFSGAKSVTLNVVAKKPASSGCGNGGGSGASNNNSGGGTTSDKKEYSSDNSLKSLSVDGYKFEKDFNKDTLEYKLTVDESVEKIKVNATPNHAKATVKGGGEINLSSGENTLEIKVTAENGNEKTYKIIVNVVDQNPIIVNVLGEEFTIVKKNNKLIEPLDYFNEVTLNIKDQEVVAYENTKAKITLLMLKDKENKINYYVFDKYNNSYELYRYITVGGITLHLLKSPDKLENFTKYKLELQDQNIDFYKVKGSHNVGLIYGVNVKTGNTGYYVYDKNEESLSKYYDEEIKIYEKELLDLKNYLMIFLGIFAFIGIVIIVLSMKKSKNNKKNYLKI